MLYLLLLIFFISNKYINGLTENYGIKNHESSTTNIRPIEVVFIIDSSYHVSDMLFRQELLLIPKLMDKLPLINRDYLQFGLMTYGSDVQLQIGIGRVNNKRALLHKLWRIKRRKTHKSNLAYAFRVARHHLFANSMSQTNRYIIVISNGDWDFHSLTSLEARRLQKNGIQILMVVTNQKQRMQAQALTRKIIYNPIISMNYIDQRNFYTFIINNIYPIPTKPTFSTTATSTIGTSFITVYPTSTSSSTSALSTTTQSTSTPLKSTSPSTTTTSTTASSISTPSEVPLSCDLSGQLTILIDSSSTVEERANFVTQLELLYNVLSKIYNVQSSLKLFVVSYGNKTINYLEIRGDLNPILNINFLGGENNGGAALSEVNQKIVANSPLNIKQRIVMFFGGISTTGPDPIIVSRVMKRQKGTRILAIGFNEKPQLRWFVSQVGSEDVSSIYMDNINDNERIRLLLINSICKM